MDNLHTFWRGLSDEEQTNFALKAELSKAYIEVHLIHKRKSPRLKTIQSIADASNGALTVNGLVAFFMQTNPLSKNDTQTKTPAAAN